MKHFLPAVASLVTLAFMPGPAAQGADVDWYTRITLGGLRLGLKEADVIAALGQPKEKGETVEEAATGLFVTEWAWPGLGVWITFGAETAGGPRTVERLQITAPSKLKTPEGVGVGSKSADVLAIYKTELDPETPPTEEAIVAGSLFGGMIFTLENGVVREIFLGAAAE